MSAVGLDWPHKLLALQEAVHWASERKLTVVFRDSQQADAVRQGTAMWATLALDSIVEVGDDQVTREFDGDPGDPNTQLVEVYSGQRDFTVELRVFTRDQRLGGQAWYWADRVRTRLRKSAYAREKWLVPNDVAIRSLPQVVNLSPRTWQGRAESEAVLEMMLSTVVCDRSTENTVNWIDTVLLSSNIQGIDASLNLSDDPITGS